MSESRLTQEECQAIAERTLESLGDISVAEALARFDVGTGHLDEVVDDGLSGQPFRRMVFARSAPGGRVMLMVSVDPEPQLVRHARRFKLLAEFIEGWQGQRSSGVAAKVISASVAPGTLERSG